MEKLELANTIGQMKDKINEIINSIEENVTEIKLYNASNSSQYLTIIYNGTEITYLSDSAQQAIVEMAESILWRQDNKQTRAQVAKQNAIEIITSIEMINNL